MSECIPNAGGTTPPQSLTLSQFFEQHYLPIRLGEMSGKITTINSYRQTVSVWDNEGLASVTIEKIDQAKLVLFREALKNREQKGKKLSNNTIRRHFRHLNAILNFAGPKSRYCRDALGLIPEVPYVRVPPKVQRDPVPADLQAISRLFTVFNQAKLPTGLIWPEDWWRVCYYLLLNTGVRRGTLLSLRWEYIDQDYLIIPGELTKGSKDLRVPLLPHTLGALDRISGLSPGIILPVTEQHVRTVTKENGRLNALAGNVGRQKVTFQSVRRCVLTRIGMQNAAAAQMAGSHSDMQTTLDHYLSSEIYRKTVREVDLCSKVAG